MKTQHTRFGASGGETVMHGEDRLKQEAQSKKVGYNCMLVTLSSLSFVIRDWPNKYQNLWKIQGTINIICNL